MKGHSLGTKYIIPELNNYELYSLKNSTLKMKDNKI